MPPSLMVAGGGLFEPGDHPQHRRLARARRAEDREQLAVVDGQVGALDGHDLATEFLAQSDQFDLGCSGRHSGILRNPLRCRRSSDDFVTRG